MELKFMVPDVRRWDQATSEVLAVTLSSDERPPRGAAGLVDWRLSGLVARLMHRGLITGSLGEVVLLPGRPKLPFEKVLFFGFGSEKDFDEGVFRLVLDKMLDTVQGLRVRTAVAELPGRRIAAVAPERALALLLDATQDRSHQDLWTLMEPPEVHKSLNDYLFRERRRGR